MNDECERCGLDDLEYKCYIYELEERMLELEEKFNHLFKMISFISNQLKIKENPSDL